MMKLLKTLTMAMICIAMTIFVSCKKNNVEPSDVFSIPTVTTGEFKIITAASAICGGEVTNENGAKVTERGVCWGIESNPTLSGSHTVDSLGVGVFTSSIAGLLPETKYYVRAYAINSAGVGYGAEKSFTTYPDNGMINGHEYIDLGLPSGLLWATCNVGANFPEEHGDYFAWGETTPKSNFDWGTYKWCHGYYTTLIKYNIDSIYGTVDNKTQLEPEDDAAHVSWDGSWRIPIVDEQRELANNCTCEWITQNEVKGMKLTGPNGNSIFLPAAGYYSGGCLHYASSDGGYWSSSLYSSSPYGANYLLFGPSGVSLYYGYRSVGQSVRPVSVRQK